MRMSEGEGVQRGQDLDWRSVDWPRARRAVYTVRQRYTYTYTAPVAAIRQRLIMLPRDQHGDQRLLEHHLTVHVAQGPVLTWQDDVFGKRVGQEMAFDARYQIERSSGGTARTGLALAQIWDDGVYLDPTALTAPDAA